MLWITLILPIDHVLVVIYNSRGRVISYIEFVFSSIQCRMPSVLAYNDYHLTIN